MLVICNECKNEFKETEILKIEHLNIFCCDECLEKRFLFELLVEVYEEYKKGAKETNSKAEELIVNYNKFNGSDFEQMTIELEY